MAMDVTTKGIFINFNLGDVKRSAEATEQLKNTDGEQEGHESKRHSRGSQSPEFAQSYTGKGGLLDLIA